MTIGFNLIISSGLRVLLSRNDHEFEPENPYSCLLDKSCTEATFDNGGAKNQLRLSVILASGLYKIMILEKQTAKMTEQMNDEIGLEYKLFTFGLEAFPVI